MATYYWIGGGANTNWATVANWSTASAGTTTASVAPTINDDIIFDGQGTNGNTNSFINTAFSIRSLTVRPTYTAAISHSSGQLQVSGNISLSPNYTISASSATNLRTDSTCTIDMGGQVWPGTFTFGGSGTTKTISGSNLVVTGDYTDIGNSMTINRFSNERMILSSWRYTLFVVPIVNVPITIRNGSINNSGASPTFNGGMFISGNISIANPCYFTGLLVYQSGSVNTNGTTFIINGSSTFDVEPITWNNFTFAAGGTMALSSSLNISGSTTVSAATTLNIASAANPSASLNVRGGITTSAALSGNAKVVLIRGTWAGSSSPTVLISNNTDISGSITIGTNARYGGTATNCLRWITGSVNAGSQFNLGGSCILDVERITWNRFVFQNAAGMIATLSSSVYVSGSTDWGISNGVINVAASNPTASWYTRGFGIEAVGSSGGTAAGSAKIILTGGILGKTGATMALGNDLDISGSIQISGSISPTSKTITWISGSVSAQTATLTISGQNVSINMPDIEWGNVSLSNIGTLTSVARVLISGTFSLNGNITSAGTGGWTARNVSYSNSGTAVSFTLQPNVQYNIVNSLTCNGGALSANVTFTSANAITRSILTLSPNATCNTNANFTRIDASLGRPIRTFNGTITDCRNIEQLTDIITSAGSFVATI